METLRSNGVIPPCYTTGDAHLLTKLSQQTIIRCIDAGHLVAHRVPGTEFRRIDARDLQRFVSSNNMPYHVPQTREILAITTEDIRTAIQDLLDEALDAVEVTIANPAEIREIDALRTQKKTLIVYTLGNGKEYHSAHERSVRDGAELLKILSRNTLLRSDV